MNLPQNHDSIAVIDTLHQGRPHVVATYLLLGAEPALLDPGPASTLPRVAAALAAYGLELADLRHIVLTHIHLDHAGASGLLMAHSPAARVYVHERGAPHLIDPSRLLNSATQLYGDQMERLWGQVLPVPAERVTICGEGERLRLGERELLAYDAPGHAKHHLVWFEPASGAAFVGDCLGVRLPGVPFTRPATPPPDIDLEEWQRTLDKIAALAPRRLMLTHFGPFDDVAFHLADYRERLLRWAALVRAGLESGRSEAEQIAAFEALGGAEAAGVDGPARAALEQQSGNLAANWRGLARYWRKRLGL
jgi:glyoxylase-like metal-dependent hydrolase (beta-lactamase superfamily II)